MFLVIDGSDRTLGVHLLGDDRLLLDLLNDGLTLDGLSCGLPLDTAVLLKGLLLLDGLVSVLTGLGLLLDLVLNGNVALVRLVKFDLVVALGTLGVVNGDNDLLEDNGLRGLLVRSGLPTDLVRLLIDVTGVVGFLTLRISVTSAGGLGATTLGRVLGHA